MIPLHVRQRERRQSSTAVEDLKRRGQVGPTISANIEEAILAIPPMPPIGATMGWAGTGDTPDGIWFICDGRNLSRADYPELFDAIGTTWNSGDEGPDEFGIPDHQGRATIGAGQGYQLTNRPNGSLTGAERHTLTEAEMPSHKHGMDRTDVERTKDYNLMPVREANDGGTSGSTSTNYTGGGASHNNMQPSVAENRIIRVRNHPLTA